MDHARRRILQGSAAALGAVGMGTLAPAAGAAGVSATRRLDGLTTPGLEGDLFLDPPAFASGSVTGGVIRRATALLVPWSYTQTESPVSDPVGIGTAFYVDWRATLLDSRPWVGPVAQTGWFGPRGVFHLDGEVRYGNPMSRVNITPIAFGNQLIVSNADGAGQTVTPGWGFMNAPWFLARDGRKLTLQRNDTANGMGGFVDNQLYAVDPQSTGGSVDGVVNGYEATSFVVRTFLTEGVHLAGVVGFDMSDINGEDGHLPGVTSPPPGLVDRTVGIRVAHLTKGNTFGVGVQNGSRTLYPPQTSQVAAADAILRTDATAVTVENGTAARIVLSGTGGLQPGEDGQVVTLVGKGPEPVTIRGTDVEPGSKLAGESRTVGQGDVLDLVWLDGAWHPRSPLQVHGEHGSVSVSVGGTTDHAAPSLSLSRTSDAHPDIALGHYLGQPLLALGTGDADPDAALLRSAPSVLRVAGGESGGVIEAGVRRLINDQTSVGYTVVAADRALTIVRNSASASTQTWPSDAGAPGLAIGSEVPVCNRGSGGVQHQAASGATVIVAGVQPSATRWVGVKVAANTWLVG